MKHSKGSKNVRPTTGKVREALFNILRGKVEYANFLDLYAGTGAVGIHALLDGASGVVFVDESKGNIKKIERLAARKGFSDRVHLVTGKALTFINRAGLQDSSYDIIFLDPPYHSDEAIKTLTGIGRSSIAGPGSVVIAEHSSKKPLPDRIGTLQKVRDYSYGDTVLTLYEIAE